MPESTGQTGVDRRLFLGMVGGAVGGAAVIGGTAVAAWPTDALAQAGTGEHAADGGGTATTAAPMNADEMDAMHKSGVDKFLENTTSPITKGLGAQDLAWESDGDTRVFRLTCGEVDWEVTPGQVEKALAYNGTVPGPTLRVVEGQRVRVEVTNELKESTAVHWHGQRVPNDLSARRRQASPISPTSSSQSAQQPGY